MNLQDELFRVTQALEDAQIPYALCGGLAVAIHGYPRMTRDIEILIRSEDLESARVVVSKLRFTISAGLIPFEVGTPRERSIFRVGKIEGSDHLVIDFVLLAPIFKNVWADRETHDIDGRILRVVSRIGLIAMKKIAGRPQDLADLAKLESHDEN